MAVRPTRGSGFTIDGSTVETLRRNHERLRGQIGNLEDALLRSRKRNSRASNFADLYFALSDKKGIPGTFKNEGILGQGLASIGRLRYVRNDDGSKGWKPSGPIINHSVVINPFAQSIHPERIFLVHRDYSSGLYIALWSDEMCQKAQAQVIYFEATSAFTTADTIIPAKLQDAGVEFPFFIGDDPRDQLFAGVTLNGIVSVTNPLLKTPGEHMFSGLAGQRGFAVMEHEELVQAFNEGEQEFTIASNPYVCFQFECQPEGAKRVISYSQGDVASTASSEQAMVFIANDGQEEVKRVAFALDGAPSGADTVDVDILKAPDGSSTWSTILSGPIQFTSANSDGEVMTGSIADPDLLAGDKLSVGVVVSGGSARGLAGVIEITEFG